MKNLWYCFIHSIKFKNKLLISHLLFVFLPLALVCIITFSGVLGYTRKQIIFSSDQNFTQTYSYLQNNLAAASTCCNIVATDSFVLSYLEQPQNDLSLYQQIAYYNQLKAQFLSLQENLKVSRIKLYINNNSYFTNERENIFPTKAATEQPWYSQIDPQQTRYTWFSDASSEKGKTIATARAIKSSSDIKKTVGIVSAEFNEDIIKNILVQNNTIPGGITYIRNTTGDLISCSDDQILKELGLTDNADLTEGSSIRRLPGGGKMYINSMPIEETNLVLVNIIPIDAMLRVPNQMRWMLLFILLLIFILAYIITYLISTSLTQRISLLISNLECVRNGVLNPIATGESADEIGLLFKHYNYMITHMSELIKERFESGKKLKSAELKALSAQINPHFLYNTFDLINWLAAKQDFEQIRLTVRSLAKFYKHSLNSGREITTLEEELAHVSFYVNIQNMRFSNGVRLVIDVPEEIKKCVMLNLTLQPLVENSILHGILAKSEKRGTITITGSYDDHTIRIQIHDDGVGIPEEKLKSIPFGHVHSTTGSSFGIRSSNERIQLAFGKEYGVTVESILGRSTTVTVSIPRQYVNYN